MIQVNEIVQEILAKVNGPCNINYINLQLISGASPLVGWLVVLGLTAL